MKIVVTAMVACLMVAGPAWAADDAAKVKPGAAKPADKASEKKPNPEDKLICSREEQTDSFIPKRVCRTQAQIDELRRGAQQLNDDQQLLSGRPQGGPGR
jgi:hypothetical protein